MKHKNINTQYINNCPGRLRAFCFAADRRARNRRQIPLVGQSTTGERLWLVVSRHGVQVRDGEDRRRPHDAARSLAAAAGSVRGAGAVQKRRGDMLTAAACASSTRDWNCPPLRLPIRLTVTAHIPRKTVQLSYTRRGACELLAVRDKFVRQDNIDSNSQEGGETLEAKNKLLSAPVIRLVFVVRYPR